MVHGAYLVLRQVYGFSLESRERVCAPVLNDLQDGGAARLWFKCGKDMV